MRESSRRAAVVLVTAGVLAACGGGPSDAEGQRGATPSWRIVQFRAADGVKLHGRIVGRGRVGVVMSHMARPGDTQADWSSLAQRLAREGYLVLTYNRRGVCPRRGRGCSSGRDELEVSWKDVVGADRFLRSEHGVARIVLVGASIGAMSSVHVATTGKVDATATIELGGVNHRSGYDFSRSELRRMRGAKLFVSSKGDVSGGDDAAREWFAWARQPKRLAMLPGEEHGTDMLRSHEPTSGPLTTLIVEFLRDAVPAR
jgi:pimeloyl-ACP methyl ester carboxylesterase